jgi:hypothetical protein
LYLDVSKVDQVLYLSSSHLLLYRLSQRQASTSNTIIQIQPKVLYPHIYSLQIQFAHVKVFVCNCLNSIVIFELLSLSIPLQELNAHLGELH